MSLSFLRGLYDTVGQFFITQQEDPDRDRQLNNGIVENAFAQALGGEIETDPPFPPLFPSHVHEAFERIMFPNAQPFIGPLPELGFVPETMSEWMAANGHLGKLSPQRFELIRLLWISIEAEKVILREIDPELLAFYQCPWVPSGVLVLLMANYPVWGHGPHPISDDLSSDCATMKSLFGPFGINIPNAARLCAVFDASPIARSGGSCGCIFMDRANHGPGSAMYTQRQVSYELVKRLAELCIEERTGSSLSLHIVAMGRPAQAFAEAVGEHHSAKMPHACLLANGSYFFSGNLASAVEGDNTLRYMAIVLGGSAITTPFLFRACWVAAGHGFYQLLSRHLVDSHGITITADALRLGGSPPLLVRWFDQEPSVEAVEALRTSAAERARAGGYASEARYIRLAASFADIGVVFNTGQLRHTGWTLEDLEGLFRDGRHPSAAEIAALRSEAVENVRAGGLAAEARFVTIVAGFEAIGESFTTAELRSAGRTVSELEAMFANGRRPSIADIAGLRAAVRNTVAAQAHSQRNRSTRYDIMNATNCHKCGRPSLESQPGGPVGNTMSIRFVPSAMAARGQFAFSVACCGRYDNDCPRLRSRPFVKVVHADYHRAVGLVSERYDLDPSFPTQRTGPISEGRKARWRALNN